MVLGLLTQKSWTKNEFKYLIESGKVECFYQHVEIDSVFHASIQVLKGNDVNFYIVDSNQTLIYHLIQKQSGSHQVQKSPGQGKSILF